MSDEVDDFYLEFLDELGRVVNEDLDWLSRDALLAGRFSLRRALENYLWCSGLSNRDEYNRRRLASASKQEAIDGLHLGCLTFPQTDPRTVARIADHPWFAALEPLRGRTLFFCSGKRNLDYMREIISSYPGEAVVLSDVDCSAEPWLSKRKMAVGLELSRYRFYDNLFMESVVPHFFAYANTLLLMMELLQPARVVVNDGCQTKYMIVAAYCHAAGIRSFCIQQGWPSILHQGFRNLPYSDFLTWGEGFSELLAVHNPLTRFTACGYPYRVETVPVEERRAICFFLQEPLFIADGRSEAMMIEAIRRIARAFADRPVYVRRHPLDKRTLGFEEGNITLCDREGIGELMGRCKAVVSHFSSCIMESLIHGCVPVVIDPAAGSRYNPDIEALGMGFIRENIGDIEETVRKALRRPVVCRRGKWCEAVADEAISRICSAIG